MGGRDVAMARSRCSLLGGVAPDSVALARTGYGDLSCPGLQKRSANMHTLGSELGRRRVARRNDRKQ